MGMVLHGDPSLEFFLPRLSLRLRLDFLVTAEAEADRKGAEVEAVGSGHAREAAHEEAATDLNL